MKKLSLLVIAVLFVTSLTAQDNVKSDGGLPGEFGIAQKAGDNQFNFSGTSGRDVDLLFEDWEDGLGSWNAVDENATPPMWHLDSWNAYNGSGESWWISDPDLGNNGGYNNSWYQVLDTDPIALSGSNLKLTFYHRYKVESPGGEPTGYDGWDGMNVRISSDGGDSWEVLTNPSDEYDASSLYSFGNEHGEGQGVPGWAGSNNSWTEVEFDLSSYEDETVMIRFAFASDPAYSTADQAPGLYGWQVDNILVKNSGSTLFENTGGASGLTAMNNVPSGGNLWSVVQGGAFSGTNLASCNNDEGTYGSNMNNSLVSDYIYLHPLAVEIYMDFYFRGDWSDNDEFPNVDFFGVYVQVEGESVWRYVSNVELDPDSNNYVYSGAPSSWTLFSEFFTSGLIDLSPLSGETVRVKFTFESDDDQPQNTALQLDDVVIYTPQEVPVELTSFTAAQTGSEVKLKWRTATEINNSGFEVQRKIYNNEHESDWTVVAFKEGEGTTSHPVQYSHLDKIENIEASSISYRLKQVDYDGTAEFSDVVEIENVAPADFKLDQNYPNPFNPVTVIEYGVPADNFVNLNVYNSLGEEVAELVNEFKSAGSYKVRFNAGDLPSGLYLYEIRAGESKDKSSFQKMKKMLLIK